MRSVLHFSTPAVWRLLFSVLLIALLSGCATTHFASDSETRAATDVPDHFLVGMPNDATTTEPSPGEGCRNPMVDPRDGTRVRLVRSGESQGDYEVPAGRYGVGEGELLRLECGTGQAVGIVQR